MDQLKSDGNALVIFSGYPDIPGGRVLVDEFLTIFVGVHVSQGAGCEQPDVDVVNAQFLGELRNDTVQDGGAGSVKTLDELVSVFKGLVIIGRGAGGVDDDIGKVLADGSLEFVGDVIADGDSE